ncbi:MAG: hypothetical protein NVSMB55_00710 [Mycobacteriales bacterium]
MGQVEDEFAASPLWQAVTQLGALLDGLPDNDDPQVIEHVVRLRWLQQLLAEQRKQEPRTVPAVSLNNLHSVLANVTSNLQNYMGNPAAWPSYLAPAATAFADQVLLHVATLPPLPDGRQAATEAAAREFEKQAGRMVEGLKAKIAELTTTVARQAEAIEAGAQQQAAQSAEAAAAAARQQQSLEEQVRTLSATITEQSARLDTAITTQNEAFVAQQTERAERAKAQIAEAQEQAVAVRADIAAAAEADRKRQAEAAEEHLKVMRRLEEQAEAVVKATGRRAITTEYGQYAQGERRAALVWNILAVIFGLGGFAFIVYESHLLGGKSNPSWTLTATKLAGSLALLAVAGYAGRQASEHKGQERDAKRTQLDINAVEPFLTRLPEEKQDDLRANVAERLFAHRPQPETLEPAPPDDADLSAIAKAVGTGIRAALPQPKPSA